MQTHTTAADLPTEVLDWGSITWLITETTFSGTSLSFGEVVVNPGQGHDVHRHSDADEVLYVLDGEGEQTVGSSGPFPIRPGDAVYVPRGVDHSTFNTGWRQLRFTVTYNPAGAEQAIRALPDYEQLAPGTAPRWVRQHEGAAG